MTDSQEPKGQEQETDIKATSGKPYTTTSRAMFAMVQKDLDTTAHVIVPVEGGFVIRAKEAGATTAGPETTASAAPPTPAAEKPAESAAPSAPAVEEQPVQGAAPAAPEEKVFWVTFADRSSEQEQEKVILTVNHDTLLITRMKKIPLPERFIECAKHASRPHFKQLPGHPRKVMAHVHTYPHTIHEEATWEDYHSMRRSGSEKARQDRELANA